MIKIKNISKVYKVYQSRSHRILEWLIPGLCKHKEYKALQDISLEVDAGVSCGVIGMNGAGKSTLLKILTGTSFPTSGTLEMSGRVSSLLELGTGFHPELSGRENAIINGKLLGLTQDEILARLDEILAFSELRDFFDEPVRTYSSGMYVRLAFALATAVKPDVLIIDEALSVGDAYFQQKCLKKIEEFKSAGVTILLVSHDPAAIKLLCDQAALLDRGRIVKVGDPVECLELYNALLAKKDGRGDEYSIEQRATANGNMTTIAGNNKASITDVTLSDGDGKPVTALVAGSRTNIRVAVRFNEAIDSPTIGLLIRDRLGYDVFGTNTAQMQRKTGSYAVGQEAVFDFEMNMNLGPGEYTITAAAHSSLSHVDDCYQWVDRILAFKVLERSDFGFLGVSMLETTLKIDDQRG